MILLRAALVACAMTCIGAAPAPAPAVVELFQSQGCSSCPPANANINAIAARDDLVVLSFGVTYWDDLGWKDTFASPQYTARQYAYARGLGHSGVATPQVVINGRRDVTGIDGGDLATAIRTTARSGAAAIAVSPTIVTVGAGPAPGRPADVWLVRYDPAVRQVAIRRGENGGRTLPHRNIVRQLTRIGAWTGGAQTYAVAPAADGLATAVLVQAPNGGPILAAAKG
jgi:hypothetical protein